MDEGRFTIPTRVYLDDVQRAKLDHLLREQERDLDELLSELLAAFLADLPAPPQEPPPDRRAAMADELRRRRAELRRLRPRLHDDHNPAPAWLTQMAGEIEAEIRRLEQALNA